MFKGKCYLYLFCSSLDLSTCYPGQVGFSTSVSTAVKSVNYLTGTPTVCVSGSGLPICNGTSLDSNVLFLICLQSTGYTLISKSE